MARSDLLLSRFGKFMFLSRSLLEDVKMFIVRKKTLTESVSFWCLEQIIGETLVEIEQTSAATIEEAVTNFGFGISFKGAAYLGDFALLDPVNAMGSQEGVFVFDGDDEEGEDQDPRAMGWVGTDGRP